MKIKICDVCGKPFEAHGNSKRCSPKCEKIAYEKSKKENKRRENRARQSYMKENNRYKTEKPKTRKKRDGNKSLIAKNTEARAAGLSYGQYAAREAAAAVKVDVNIGGDRNVGDRKST